MSETKWAKSPWHVVQYGDGDSLVICSDVDGNWRICFMATHGGSQSSRKRIQAEADLIAAAPDLYAALEEVTDALVATLVFVSASATYSPSSIPSRCQSRSISATRSS